MKTALEQFIAEHERQTPNSRTLKLLKRAVAGLERCCVCQDDEKQCSACDSLNAIEELAAGARDE
jgi:hypothetical protein